ncbi:hypothetical protein ACFYY8_31825 [Streptosporangium sp. NPDC001559]|uniref:hypothetical protein n=1 Tax=Streptosporangium sp. NPDC001559 TaxID=3366187 RepID=UPI0036E9D4C1
MRIVRLFAALAAAGSIALLTQPAEAAPLNKPAASTAQTIYRGEGDEVLRVPATTKPGTLRVTHDGEGAFMVQTLTSSGKKDDLLIAEIGPYQGTVAYNTTPGKKLAALSIEADGAWTVQFVSLAKAKAWPITARGTGDQVLRLASPSRGFRTLAITHSGEGAFMVEAYKGKGYTDLLVAKIDSYKGKVVLPAGTQWLLIKANGPWTVVRK